MPQSGDFNRYLCICVDIARYSAGDAQSQRLMQRQLSEMLSAAATAAHLDRVQWLTQPQGDGELALVPVGPSEPRVVDDFVRHLDAELELYNRDRRPDSRMRLRVAMHTGIATPAALGFAGPAVVVVSRLLNAAPARRALAEDESANMALIASGTAFEIVAMGHTTLRPSWFTRVEVTEKEYVGEAWIWVPNQRRAPVDVDHSTNRTPAAERHVVGNLPRRASHFQSRTNQLAQLTTGSPVPTFKVIVGTGGVGKTQLAADYARSAWRDGAADLIIWANAASREGIVSAYIQSATVLGAASADDGEQAAGTLMNYLATTDHRWLVVLDDVRVPRDADGLWPPQSPNGSTIVTTRRRDAALTHLGDVISLGPFDLEQSTMYLNEWLKAHPGAIDETDGLAADLGYLPLALAQAAAYIADRQLTCRQYRQRFRDQRRKLHQIVPESDSLPDGHQNTIATTWALSIDAANRFPPPGLAGRALNLAAVLDPNGIPLAVFTAAPSLRYLVQAASDDAPDTTVRPSTVKPATVKPSTEALATEELATEELATGELATVELADEQVTDTLANLHRLNLADVSDDRLRVHALVQRAVIDSLPDDDLDAVVRAAADALIATWPAIERDQGHTAMLRRNAAALIARHPDPLWQPRLHPIVRVEANSYGHVGMFESSLDAYTRLLHEASGRRDPDHDDIRTARSGVARWTGELGDPVRAYEQYRALRDDCVRVLGPDHPQTLAAWHDGAYWQGVAGDTKGAAAEFAALLAHRLRVRPDDRREILETRSSLARWQGASGDPTAAVAAYESLLADSLELLGPEHQETLNTRHGLAYWRGEAGDPAGAAAAFEELLADRERLLGADSRDTLRTRSDVARWRGDAGDAQWAADAFAQLLADCQRVLGPNHPDTLNARHSFAYWRGMAGDPARAAADFEELLPEYRRLGAGQRDVLVVCANIARWRGDAGDADGAVRAFEEVLRECLAVFGPDHLDTMMARHSLAYWTGRAGDPAAAADAFEALLADQQRLLVPNHRDTLSARTHLARFRGEAGDPAGAAAALRTLLADCLTVLGPEHPQTIDVQHQLARFAATD